MLLERPEDFLWLAAADAARRAELTIPQGFLLPGWRDSIRSTLLPVQRGCPRFPGVTGTNRERDRERGHGANKAPLDAICTVSVHFCEGLG